MVGFDNVPFVVRTRDGRLPLPERDDDRLLVYEARIGATRANATLLSRRKSLVTAIPGLGMFGGTVMIEAGFGAAALTIPLGHEMEATYQAVMVAWSGGAAMSADDVEMTVRFYLLGEPSQS